MAINQHGFNIAPEAGKVFDNYIITNNLEHTINNVETLPSFSQGK